MLNEDYFETYLLAERVFLCANTLVVVIEGLSENIGREPEFLGEGIATIKSPH